MHVQPISLHSDFDAASLQGYRIDGKHIILTPRSHPFNGQPTGAWTYFRVEGAKDLELTFSFDTSECVLHGHWRDSRYFVSENQQDWHVVDHTCGENESYQFTQKITSDPIWIAHSIPYPMQRIHDKAAEWLKHPAVSPVASANELGCLTHFEYPEPLYAFKITQESTHPKQSIILMGGNHPGEHQASYCLEGLMDWLLSEDSKATALRLLSEIYLYPMVNPSGRLNGYTRGNNSIPQGDHNRMWGEMDRGLLPNIDRIKKSICENIAGPVSYFLDFHNTERTQEQFIYINSDIMYAPGTDQLLPFPQALIKDASPFYLKPTDSYVIESHNTTAKTWAMKGQDGPQAMYAFTIEAGNKVEPTPRQSVEFGKAIGRALLAGLRAFNQAAF